MSIIHNLKKFIKTHTTPKVENGYVIGRFQPLHKGHVYLIEQAHKRSKALTVLVGSSYTGRSLKNPFTYQERKEMLLAQFGDSINVEPLPDLMREDDWLRSVEEIVGSGTIFGYQRDDGSSDWVRGLQGALYEEIEPLPELSHISATKFRDDYLYKGYDLLTSDLLPSAVYVWMFSNDRECNLINNDLPAYKKEIDEYRGQFKHPYMKSGGVSLTVDALFYTTDQDGSMDKVLLIKRGDRFGELAFAGGFVDEDESSDQAIIREVKEELGLTISDYYNDDFHYENTYYVDTPDRDDRGRITTAVYTYEVDEDYMRQAVAGDDAKEVVIMNVEDVKHMFADHHMILMDIKDDVG